jgi:hypothetical protein
MKTKKRVKKGIQYEENPATMPPSIEIIKEVNPG